MSPLPSDPSVPKTQTQQPQTECYRTNDELLSSTQATSSPHWPCFPRVSYDSVIFLPGDTGDGTLPWPEDSPNFRVRWGPKSFICSHIISGWKSERDSQHQVEETKSPSDLLREGTKEILSTLEWETGRNRYTCMHTGGWGRDLTTILCACSSIAQISVACHMLVVSTI